MRNFAVEIRDSNKGGYGVYALQKFDSGMQIRERNIVREITAEAPVIDGEQADHVCTVGAKQFLVGEPDCFINHSCDPNAYLLYKHDRIYLIALRNIEAEDEITLDYLINNAGGDSWFCNCGTSRCRGNTGTSFFDLPIELQKEYAPYLADWFKLSYSTELKHLI